MSKSPREIKLKTGRLSIPSLCFQLSDLCLNTQRHPELYPLFVQDYDALRRLINSTYKKRFPRKSHSDPLPPDLGRVGQMALIDEDQPLHFHSTTSSNNNSLHSPISPIHHTNKIDTKKPKKPFKEKPFFEFSTLSYPPPVLDTYNHHIPNIPHESLSNPSKYGVSITKLLDLQTSTTSTTFQPYPSSSTFPFRPNLSSILFSSRRRFKRTDRSQVPRQDDGIVPNEDFIASLSPDQDFSSQEIAELHRRKTIADQRRKTASKTKSTISITEGIHKTIREMAADMNLKGGTIPIIKELLKMGEEPMTIDDEMMSDLQLLLCEEMNHPYRIIKGADIELPHRNPAPSELLSPRVPVVTIMGHVNHGKTSLLDYLRGTDVVSVEAGAITQHMSCFIVTDPESKKQITFIDTPGHAAFKEMRKNGASATDLVVLVVDGGEGPKIQTREVIRACAEADVPVIVALTKLDTPKFDEKNATKALNQLSHDVTAFRMFRQQAWENRVLDRKRRLALGVPKSVLPSPPPGEDWDSSLPDPQHPFLLEDQGGEVQVIPISAKTGEGIPHLLEAIHLQSELLHLSTDSSDLASAIILETRHIPGVGLTMNVIVRSGTFQVRDSFFAGSSYGTIRTIYCQPSAISQPRDFDHLVSRFDFPEEVNNDQFVPDFDPKLEINIPKIKKNQKIAISTSKELVDDSLFSNEADYTTTPALSAGKSGIFVMSYESKEEPSVGNTVCTVPPVLGGLKKAAEIANYRLSLKGSQASRDAIQKQKKQFKNAMLAQKDAITSAVPMQNFEAVVQPYMLDTQKLKEFLNKAPPGISVNLIVKADVQGTADACAASILKFNQVFDEYYQNLVRELSSHLIGREVETGPTGGKQFVNLEKKYLEFKAVCNLIRLGLGTINPSDVKLAELSNSIIVSFNAAPPPSQVKADLTSKKITFANYDVIYQLLDFVRDQIISRLPTPTRQVPIGVARIDKIFQINTRGRIFESVAGSKIVAGDINIAQPVKILAPPPEWDPKGPEPSLENYDWSRWEVIFQGQLKGIKKYKEDVKSVQYGDECGLSIVDYDNLTKGNYIVSFKEQRLETQLPPEAYPDPLSITTEEGALEA